MRVAKIEVFVEEPSMEMALRALLPKMIGTTAFEVYPHHDKPNLLAVLPGRLRAYAKWMPDDWRILVVVDRDNDDCVELKTKLDKIAKSAGFATRAGAREKRRIVITRIAIEELEAWYFGDWEAVRASYPRVSATVPSKGKYRDPDAIAGGTWEAFERVLKKAGYFPQHLPKIEAARTIAPNMIPERNTSRSFQALRRALTEMVKG